MSLGKKECKYCENEYSENKEHVFPYGLGGENIYVDFVCNNCNNLFSRLEGELYQKSIISLMRSAEGIEGYKPTKSKPSPLKASLCLILDKENGIIYEGGQFQEFQIYLRPQVIDIEGKYYAEGSSNKDIEKLARQFHKWKKTSLRAINGSKIQKGYVKEYFECEMEGGEFEIKSIKGSLKVKSEIRIDVLPKSNNLHDILTARLFLDDRDPKNNRLRIRAQSVKQAIEFLKGFLDFTSVKRTLNCYPQKNLDDSIITIGLNWDESKLERALAKIGLNCLMHYFPESRNSDKINSLLEFVFSGTSQMKGQLINRNTIIDSNPKTHNLLFFQSKTNFSIRISLFNGSFTFVISIPELELIKEGTYRRLVVDYKNRINKFEDQSEFINSFSPRDKMY
ncbi:MAG: HNH endonuclease [Reichenbachiella sp.]|uniref:HNH endonuclease n=1 Tax=Reichenbachiella sp. TaxID=2184521 RepID=UPI0032660B4E